MLSIPKGARNPEAAWEFIKFVQRPENMEFLCLGQKKFSPLRKVSSDFYGKHENQYIRLFAQLAESPNAQIWPQMAIQNEYMDELGSAFENVWLVRDDPAHALATAVARVQPKLDKMLKQWARVEKRRVEEWSR